VLLHLVPGVEIRRCCLSVSVQRIQTRCEPGEWERKLVPADLSLLRV
jgi:hypothetical protein